MTSSQAEIERDKYARMWSRSEYRCWSPGAESADEALAIFGRRGSVIDFGCGEGLTVEKFRAAGLEATGIDHVRLHPDTVTACLWDIPATLAPADYGFCADVMEHIPTDRVDDVLRSIAGKVRSTAYFRISTIPDGMGSLIGETLHLTVRPADWWFRALCTVFVNVDSVRITSDHVILLGRHA